MKPVAVFLLVITQMLLITVRANSNHLHNGQKNNSKYNSTIESDVIIAINDTFILNIRHGFTNVSGNVMLNDSKNFENGYRVNLLDFPRTGKLTFKSNGGFTFENTEGYKGYAKYKYKLFNSQNESMFAEAEVFILIDNDYDYDGVVDEIDLDDDNDGILDIHEGEGKIDSDNDGIANCSDIDSDNDGVTDIIEWQKEGEFIAPSGIDANKNGWDDAYEPALGGIYYEQTDTDSDGTPDYLDTDTDDDGFPDHIECFDSDCDNMAETSALNCDSDCDGLDDAYDSVHGWINRDNSTGTNALLADSNNNGIRNWRDNQREAVPGNDNAFSENEKLFLYPNPAINNVYLNIPVELINQKIRIEFYNAAGKLLNMATISNNVNAVNVNSLESGLYFVKIRSNSYTSSQRLIINH